jgi:hypothetical protein
MYRITAYSPPSTRNTPKRHNYKTCLPNGKSIALSPKAPALVGMIKTQEVIGTTCYIGQYIT